MKKIIALMLALLMFVGTGAIADGLLGGWTVAEILMGFGYGMLLGLTQ